MVSRRTGSSAPVRSGAIRAAPIAEQLLVCRGVVGADKRAHDPYVDSIARWPAEDGRQHRDTRAPRPHLRELKYEIVGKALSVSLDCFVEIPIRDLVQGGEVTIE